MKRGFAPAPRQHPDVIHALLMTRPCPLATLPAPHYSLTSAPARRATAPRSRWTSRWASRWASAIRRLVAASAAVACLTGASVATARDYMALEPMEGKKVNVDGMLSEWPGQFVPLNVTVRGAPVSTQALVGYDAKYLYFALKTQDDRIARTASAGPNEDHLTWRVQVPTSRKTYRVDIYPGDPGKLAGLVKVDGKKVAGAEAVENPQSKGYHLEARVPWSALPEASRVRVGLSGVLEYTDASTPGRVRAVVANGKGKGTSLPLFPLESEAGLFQALLEPKGLGFTPAREAYGNVFGGAEVERVAIYGHFLSIVGPGYRDGKQFYFNELRVGGPKSVLRLDLVDFDGDGRSEIILEQRIGKDAEHRDVLQVLRIGSDGAPEQVFAHEVAIKTPQGHVRNKVTVQGKGKNAAIVIAQGTAKGFEPDTFREPTIDGIPAALLPWDTVASRTFRWQGRGLAPAGETTWTPKVKSRGAGSRSVPPPSSAAAAPGPLAPRPPNADELLERVYDLYRRDRGVGRSTARFDFVTDVVEDERPERVLVHGKDIVVFGKGFRRGLTYTFITVGVKEPEHILDATARDLTGDGKAEILVRALLEAKASKELGGDTVQREVLYVYKVLGEKLTRIFAAETGRALGDRRVAGAVAFTPRGSGVDIVLRPARAIGWSERTYPFPEDLHPAGGVEPLLLPWGTQRSRSYTFRDAAYELR